jgi:hypothetical protein
VDFFILRPSSMFIFLSLLTKNVEESEGKKGKFKPGFTQVPQKF